MLDKSCILNPYVSEIIVRFQYHPYQFLYLNLCARFYFFLQQSHLSQFIQKAILPGPHFLTTHKKVNPQISISRHSYDHPENHRNLLKRGHISSYVEAFFVQGLRHLLNKIGCGVAEITQKTDLIVFAFPTYFRAENPKWLANQETCYFGNS